ncbi:hypothetical protein [Stutzerimonas kirkiae]|uniref:Uncharacterized protein n=1 Tax=Stutzerimonas kirkiae TaxID=2211392 RepID=A0A4Q9QZL8_9GAMM|nr:hypothetical protein [Stutzerimonas kirkiae]TBU90083.1 hypothetical protein DNJ96_17150 [Stutzerimonas kirkiae]TBU99057.1 hypothetical protein DNJ95_17215 [Stutzerimonas kirkiae]TBV10209.1 hypothetical protein DNK01_18305 [Stutzerimonas kirkiae]TBV11647.1 hypothetical protein DNK08_03285 [Stutzerimonas kirkiae]
MASEACVEEGLYERVLQRLATALQDAGDEGTDERELEIHGLTPAEFELIRAYLHRDSQWLSGWHAAAREQAQQAHSFALKKLAMPLAVQQTLTCALCNSDVRWPVSPGPAVCPACGSQLLRARQRLCG